MDIGAFELHQSFVVTTLQDKDDGSTDPGVDHGAVSLRDLIAQANASSTPQTITFAPGLTGTITLTLGELQITNSMTIDGPGANLLSISGNNASRVFEIDSTPSGLTNCTISGLTIMNGSNGSARFGGGINNRGNLTLESVVVSHNAGVSSAQYRGEGGGIYSSGSLTITGSTISDNTASNFAGGIYSSGSLTITGSTISDNTAGKYGGGISCGGSLTITGSTISDNTAGRWGGGIVESDSLILDNCTIADNTAESSAGFYFSGTAALHCLHGQRQHRHVGCERLCRRYLHLRRYGLALRHDRRRQHRPFGRQRPGRTGNSHWLL